MNRFSSFKSRFLFVGMLVCALGFFVSPISNVWAEGHATDAATHDHAATTDTATPAKTGCSQIGTNSAGFGMVMLALIVLFVGRARSEAKLAAVTIKRQ